ILDSEAPSEGKTSLASLRQLAQRVNQAAEEEPEEWKNVHAGDMTAFGLLNDIFRYLIDQYCLEEMPGSMQEALDRAGTKSGVESVSKQVHGFVDFFPPKTLKQEKTPKE